MAPAGSRRNLPPALFSSKVGFESKRRMQRARGNVLLGIIRDPAGSRRSFSKPGGEDALLASAVRPGAAADSRRGRRRLPAPRLRPARRPLLLAASEFRVFRPGRYAVGPARQVPWWALPSRSRRSSREGPRRQRAGKVTRRARLAVAGVRGGPPGRSRRGPAPSCQVADPSLTPWSPRPSLTPAASFPRHAWEWDTGISSRRRPLRPTHFLASGYSTN